MAKITVQQIIHNEFTNDLIPREQLKKHLDLIKSKQIQILEKIVQSLLFKASTMNTSASLQSRGQSYIALNENNLVPQHSGLEIQAVVEGIKQGIEIINESTKGHIVLFWGFSGTGKSSAIITLNGQKLLGYHKGEPILIEANPTKVKNGVKIQIQAKAGTIYPAVLELKYRNGKQKVMLWDMPGIGDNRGATQSLINSYLIHRTFEFQPSVKLVLLIEFYQIVPNKRGAHLQNNLNDLTKIFGKLEDYWHAVTIMVSKVPPNNDETLIIDFLKQILNNLPYINQNLSIKLLLTKIINKDIPLIIFNQPKLSSECMIKVENAIDVTPQYSNFIQKMYDIITNRLTPAIFQKLCSPAMSTFQIKKCYPLIKQTYEQIDQIIGQIKEQLPLFIREKTQSIKFSTDLRKLQVSLKQFQKIQTFVTQISKKGRQIQNCFKKQEIKAQFDQLKILFEKNSFLIARNKYSQRNVCGPMENLNNSYIMIKILNNYNFEGTQIQVRWKDESKIIIALFNAILSCKLEEHVFSIAQYINANLKHEIKNSFDAFLEHIPKENTYSNWVQQSTLALVLSFNRFDVSESPQDYFNNLLKDLQEADFVDTSTIQVIINMIRLNQDYLPQLIQYQFILSQIKPVYYEKGRQFINDVIKQLNLGPFVHKNNIYETKRKFERKNLSENQMNLLKKLQDMQRDFNQYVEMHKQAINEKEKEIADLKLQNKRLKTKADSCCEIY